MDSDEYPTTGMSCIHIPQEMSFPKEMFLMPDKDYDYMGEVLVPEGLIKNRVDKLAS
jgi:hypoxanthine phosphoribosyltransferase